MPQFSAMEKTKKLSFEMRFPGLYVISVIGAPELFLIQTPNNFIPSTINNTAIYAFSEAIKLKLCWWYTGEHSCFPEAIKLYSHC